MDEKWEGRENAKMENRNQHMQKQRQHTKTGAMRGVAAEPAQQHVALRHASAPAAAGKQRHVKKDKKN